MVRSGIRDLAVQPPEPGVPAFRCDTKISRNRRAVNAALGLFVPNPDNS